MATASTNLGARVRAIRNGLGRTIDDLVSATGGKLTRQNWIKIEKGEHRLSTLRSREGLASAFRLTEREVQALIDGRLSVEDAVKLVAARHAAPLGSSDSPTPEEQGERLGTLIQLGGLNQVRFPNLEICILYHLDEPGRWSVGTVASGRAGHFGAKDMTPREWERTLDDFERRIRQAPTHLRPVKS